MATRPDGQPVPPAAAPAGATAEVPSPRPAAHGGVGARGEPRRWEFCARRNRHHDARGAARQWSDPRAERRDDRRPVGSGTSCGRKPPRRARRRRRYRTLDRHRNWLRLGLQLQLQLRLSCCHCRLCPKDDDQPNSQADHQRQRQPRRCSEPLIAGVGPSGDAVPGRRRIQQEARPMDPSPHVARKMADCERRRLDRDQEIHRHNSEGHGTRLPVRRHRHQHRGPTERDVAVGDDPDQVDRREDHRQSAEMTVQPQQPRRPEPTSSNPCGGHLRGQQQTPHDRRRQQRPRHDPRRPRHEPPDLRVHAATGRRVTVS